MTWCDINRNYIYLKKKKNRKKGKTQGRLWGHFKDMY